MSVVVWYSSRILSTVTAAYIFKFLNSNEMELSKIFSVAEDKYGKFCI